MTRLRALGACLALALCSTVADASSITVADSTNGGLYTLDVALESGTPSTYVVTLTADFGGSNPLLVNAAYIEAAELKTATSYSSISFLSGPSGATWAAIAGPSNGSGCGGVNADFVCFDPTGGGSSSGGLSIGSSTLFVWKAEVTLATGVSLSSDWHIGLQLTRLNTRGKLINAGIVSLSAPPIPEPTSAALFGLGAAVLGVFLRRRARP